MRYQHFCDCGPHFHCGEPIIHTICQSCGAEYIGPDCRVTRPLPVAMTEAGLVLCKDCQAKKNLHTQDANV